MVLLVEFFEFDFLVFMSFGGFIWEVFLFVSFFVGF